MFEACMQLIWEECVKWMNMMHPVDSQHLCVLSANVQSLIENDIDPVELKEFLTNETFIFILKKLDEFMKLCRDKSGTMTAFWMTYFELANFLLDFLRASREGDWNLHILSINELIPWCFAYNRSNYARYLPWYLLQMLNLPNSHPELNNYLLDGGFSTQIGSDNPFGCIPMDQTIEETVNKDTQTAGGTKGFSTNKSAVAKHYLTADFRAACFRQLRYMVNSQRTGIRHPDLTQPRIKKKDTEDV